MGGIPASDPQETGELIITGMHSLFLLSYSNGKDKLWTIFNTETWSYLPITVKSPRSICISELSKLSS